MKRPSFYGPGDRFPVLDFIALFKFSTAGSVFFDLGFEVGYIESAEGYRLEGDFLRAIGSLDVHYPCDGFIKAYVRVRLPEPYHSAEQLKELVGQVFYQLAIPPDETYEAELYNFAHMIAYDEQVVDRDGMTDRIYSTHDGP